MELLHRRSCDGVIGINDGPGIRPRTRKADRPNGQGHETLFLALVENPIARDPQLEAIRPHDASRKAVLNQNKHIGELSNAPGVGWQGLARVGIP